MSVNEPSTLTTGSLRIARTPRWYTGRSELIVVAGVYALAIWMTVGTVTMEVPEGAAQPGPQFFPWIVTIFLYAVATALAIEVIARPARAHALGEMYEVSEDLLEDLGDIDTTSEIRVLAPEETAPGPATAEAEGRGHIDWKTLGITTAGLVVFIFILEPIGWLISAAFLFWVLSWAFGSKRPLFDIGVAFIMSSGIQLAFGAGLGLALPAGFLEGMF